MKLEVNMYVRTKKGKIYKFETNNSMAKNGAKKYMVNCSHNIIDLIEVGDYVNGSRVMKVNCKLEYIDDDSDTGVNEVYDGIETEKTWIYFEHEINSIVTREQFSQMEYKVGE